MKQPFLGLYIHIPFCVKRCAYCDFSTNAVLYSSPIIDSYIDQLINSLELASRANLLKSIRTIYIGGGTPSYIGMSRLCCLLDAIAANIDLEQVREFTMEANPDSFSKDIAACATKRGVNRFSIGVQSTDDEVLQLLGRVHSSSQALDALKIARLYTKNVSADIICGIMDEVHSSKSQMTLRSASTLKSLQDVISLGINHVSVYPLAIEENTALEHLIAAGLLPDIDEDKQAEEMLLAYDFLTSVKPQPFERYEISNYALGGCVSQHNMGYWTGAPYLGLGYGASSMFDAADAHEVHVSKCMQVWGVCGDECETKLNNTDTNTHTGTDASLQTCDGSSFCNYQYSEGRIRISAGSMDVTDSQSNCTRLQHNKCFIERLSPKQSAAEDFMLKMRTTRGISREQLKILQNVNPALIEAEQIILDKGLAKWQESADTNNNASVRHRKTPETSNTRLVSTQTGWLEGNELFGAIWNVGNVKDTKDTESGS